MNQENLTLINRPTTGSLSTEALRSFVAICETGSFRAAAARVHKSPSAISLQITRLEQILNARLLDRDARHVALTDQGAVLLGQARRILGLHDETLALFHAAPLAGRLLLAAPHDLGVSLVPGLLRRLARLHPDIHVDVQLGNSEMVRRSFADGAANIALFNDVGAPALSTRALFSQPLVWLALDGGPALRQKVLPLAIAQSGCAWRDAALDALDKAGRPYRIAYSSDTSMGQVAALRAGLSVAALPLSLADRDLVPVPAEYDLPALPHTEIRVADDGCDLAQAVVDLIASEMLPAAT